jgi:hypothetical protein
MVLKVLCVGVPVVLIVFEQTATVQRNGAARRIPLQAKTPVIENCGIFFITAERTRDADYTMIVTINATEIFQGGGHLFVNTALILIVAIIFIFVTEIA